MAQLPRPRGVTGGLKRLNDELHLLHGRAGWPSVREMAQKCSFGTGTVYRLFTSPDLPNARVLLETVAYLAKKTHRPDPEGMCDRFDAMWCEALQEVIPDPFPSDDQDQDGGEDGPPSAGGVVPPAGPRLPSDGSGAGELPEPGADLLPAQGAPRGKVRSKRTTYGPSQSRALLIGASMYSLSTGVPSPVRDLAGIEAIADVIGSLDQFTEGLDILTDPTRDEVWRACFDVARYTEEVLFIYIDCHVLRDDREADLLLAFSDTVVTDDNATDKVVRLRDLRYLLSKSRARSVVLVLDCCVAEGDSRSYEWSSLSDLREFEQHAGLADRALPSNAFVIGHRTAYSDDESAFSRAFANSLHQDRGQQKSSLSMEQLYRRLLESSQRDRWPTPYSAVVNDGGRIEIRRPDLKSGIHDSGESMEGVARQSVPPQGEPISSVQLSAIHLWDSETGNLLREISTPTAGAGRVITAMDVAVLPDGRAVLAAGDSDGSVRLWDVLEGALANDLPVSPSGVVRAVVFALLPDGRRILAATADGLIRVWDPETGNLLREISTPTAGAGRVITAMDVAVLPDGRAVLAAGDSPQITGRVADQ